MLPDAAVANDAMKQQNYRPLASTLVGDRKLTDLNGMCHTFFYLQGARS
jgi:hypothetical protein